MGSLQSRSFLFVLWEGGGNVTPILALARRLAARGHAVRVMSDPCNEREAVETGAAFVPYTRAPHRHDKHAASTLVRDYAARSPRAALRVFLDTIACGPALAYALDVGDEIARLRPDAVVVNEFLFGGLFAAERAGVPCAMVTPGTSMLPAPGMPPPGMLPIGGPAGRFRDWLSRRITERLLASGLPALQQARRELGLPPLGRVVDYLERRDRVLLLTSHAFEFEAAFPPNVRVAGPVLDDPSWTQSADVPPIDGLSDDPLVVVGFSTTFQGHHEILQRVIDALNGWPVRGLVTLGPTLDAAGFRVPSNVGVLKAAPHARLFPHARAVVTHAGHGTIIRALAHGVPLVCMPIGRDQPGNAARVVFRKAGLRVAPAASVNTIRRAIRRVVQEPSFREAARQLAPRIRQDAEAETAVHELEHLAQAARWQAC